MGYYNNNTHYYYHIIIGHTYSVKVAARLALITFSNEEKITKLNKIMILNALSEGGYYKDHGY